MTNEFEKDKFKTKFNKLILNSIKQVLAQEDIIVASFVINFLKNFELLFANSEKTSNYSSVFDRNRNFHDIRLVFLFYFLLNNCQNVIRHKRRI